MALAVTSLAGAITASSRTIKLTAYTSPVVSLIGPQVLALVNGEFMQVTSALNAPTLEVARGMQGTGAAAAGILAPVVYGLTSDFVSVTGPAFASYGADGAIAVPTAPLTVIWLTKATAGAYTLVGPAKDQQNTVILISTTAAAHTVTYTAGFYGNTTTSDVATWPATINATLTLRAQSGTWAPVATADDGVLIG